MMSTRSRYAHCATFAFFFLATAPGTRAEVADSAANGFTVKIERQLEAPPLEAWQALVAQISAWWHPDHTFSGDANNLSIDARAQGCFCERLPPDGELRHLTVAYADPGKLLRMTGGLGPLQGLGVAGSLSIGMAPLKDGTKLTLTYAVGGYVTGELEGWAPAVDEVLTEQMDRLTRYVATGSPTN
jgi:uncharacterized protein YndB with AHSA1/START domain